MKSIQLAWHPGTARFEATGHSGSRIAFEAPGETCTVSDGSAEIARLRLCGGDRLARFRQGGLDQTAAQPASLLSCGVYPQTMHEQPALGVFDRQVQDRHDDGLHGPAAGPSPAELLLVAGAGCAAWDLVEILRKQRQDVAAIDVAVDGEQQPDAPWTFRRVELRFTVRGRGLDRRHVERAVELSVERTCSVLSTIREAATVVYTTLVEEESPVRGD